MDSYIFFIFSVPYDYKIENIKEDLKINKEKEFEEYNIIHVENKMSIYEKKFLLYLGYYKKIFNIINMI